MQREQMDGMIRRQQQSFDNCGEKIIQKPEFLQKLSQVPSLWGVLPKSPKQHYPWVLELSGEAREHFTDWLGH
eukprot:3937443-Rhodomonas_salina.2